MSNSAYELIQVHQVSAALICLWAWFCVFSTRVNDGLLGKLLFGFLGIAAFGVMVAPVAWPYFNERATVVMNVFVAGVGVRHMWMKCLWGHIKAACERWTICARIRMIQSATAHGYSNNNDEKVR